MAGLLVVVSATFPESVTRAIVGIARDRRQKRERWGNRPESGPGNGVRRTGEAIVCGGTAADRRCRRVRAGIGAGASRRQSRAAGFAGSAHPASSAARGGAGHGHYAAIGAGHRGAEPAGARQRRRSGGRDRLPAARDRATHRRPDRPRGAAAADRRRASGDPAALSRRWLCADHRLGQAGGQRPAALRGHRGADRQRQTGRRYRSGRHAGAALSQSADRAAADRFGHAGALSAAGAGRAGREPARGAGAVIRSARRAEPHRPGEPPGSLRACHHR